MVHNTLISKDMKSCERSLLQYSAVVHTKQHEELEVPALMFSTFREDFCLLSELLDFTLSWKEKEYKVKPP